LRIPAGNSCQKGIVRLEERRTLSCEVLNKSAGGYGIGIPIDSAAAFPPGRILLMEVDDLVLRVKVAHAVLDPEDDRYLIGLEVIAELEDKLAAQQHRANWYSALWPSKQGLGGQSSGLRDMLLATMFCSSLLLFTWLPTLLDYLKESKKTRSTPTSMSFNVPWNWSWGRSSYPTATAVSSDPTATQPTPAGGSPAPAAPAAAATASSNGGSTTPTAK
jgi:hypothetical protein